MLDAAWLHVIAGALKPYEVTKEIEELKRRVKQTREFLIHYNPEAV